MNVKIKILICGLAFFSLRVSAQKPVVQGDWNQLFSGPEHASDHDTWIIKMKKWRATEKRMLNYSDTEYRRKELVWTKQHFIFIQIMAHDLNLYNPITRKYTVDIFLKDLNNRYGGIDGVLLWPTYPNIGIDNRNQFDLFADMPGGLQGVKQLIADFHKRGVKVFLPIMFWDHGTRQINRSMSVALVEELKELGADGLTGDTMHGIPFEYKKKYDSLGYPLALQPELTIYDYKMLEWNIMSWNYYWKYTRVPGVSIYKWLEPKHQIHVTNRWAINKTDDLQYAFFNGIGYNPWENIWGIWNQLPDRYAEAIRRITTIYRQFPELWVSENWEPHFPTLQNGIFASRFPGDDQEIYTIVNRDSSTSSGNQLLLPYKKGMEYFDIWNGKKLTAVRVGDFIQLSFDIEGNGFGAVLVSDPNTLNKSFNGFLSVMKKASKRPLHTITDSWKPLLQKIVKIQKTTPAIEIDDDMVLIPAVNNYKFESHGVMIEGDELPSAIGVQRPWQKHPSRYQAHHMDIPAFYMDKYPIKNKQFKAFLEATNYYPEDNHNFLKDWKDGMYLKGWENKPVTWVSLEDARAFAKWAGKRLPHEWEWQYAAQGNDNRIYPWGNNLDSTKMPSPDTSRTMRAPTAVDIYPQGINAFGLMDLIGNVWQWTDEYTDEHTRFAILKGGSYYHAQSSHWYFPQAYELNKYGKYLLMAPGLDRSGTIGFRCIKDR